MVRKDAVRRPRIEGAADPAWLAVQGESSCVSLAILYYLPIPRKSEKTMVSQLFMGRFRATIGGQPVAYSVNEPTRTITTWAFIDRGLRLNDPQHRPRGARDPHKRFHSPADGATAMCQQETLKFQLG